ncbi:GntR family transcriptional regulator [Neomoorella thermoacetica]|uniref:GntR family transcriptional regulator n=1 Tax=Neomoorella thermoacetica TaxID=1525 RepID=UPI000472D9E2|nr:GntR family transcriptional regulator [Moorella thermoacetica]
MKRTTTVKDASPKILSRRVLREDIKQYLINLILNGNLQPGERIVELRIAKELGVSQAPVREAIRELEQMGLIETLPFQGAFVKKLTRKNLLEAYAVRGMMEAEAAKEAANKITTEEVERLKELVDEMMVAAKEGDVQGFIEKDIEFHEAIFRIAGNELLFKLWQSVRLSSFTVISTKLSKRSLYDLANRHSTILVSLETRDAAKAEYLARLHIEELSEEILSQIED